MTRVFIKSIVNSPFAKRVWIVALLLTNIWMVNSQDASESSPSVAEVASDIERVLLPDPTPAMPADQDDTGDVTFADDEFTFDFRSDVKPIIEAGKNGESRTYIRGEAGVYLYVFSDPKADSDRFEKVSDYVLSNSTKPDNVPKIDGKRYHFEDDGGFFHTVVLIKTETRNYVFHAVSEMRNSVVTRRFVQSIRRKSSDDRRRSVNKPNEPENESQGNGRAVDSGTYGTESPDPTPAPTPGYSRMMIRSKPRPSYTDIARIYDIQGTVILRAEFRSDGSIAFDKVIKPLPFGLTKAATKALSKIRFDPEMRDGKPASVTKNVEYTFTIF